MVSHDLRNELAGIAMSVAQIVKNASHDDAGGKIFPSATNVQRIALRMSRLIGDLLDVASIEVGRFMIAPEDHEVARTVEDAVESFQSIAWAKGISLVGEATIKESFRFWGTCSPTPFGSPRKAAASRLGRNAPVAKMGLRRGFPSRIPARASPPTA
jgi:signal transduction histidine kinase